MLCYCNSQKEFKSCCEPFISGESIADTAEQLMRSRYSAYVIANINYLMNTHHPRSRPTKERKNILKWTKSVNWVRLEVLQTEAGLEKDNSGIVEFKAFYVSNGNLECIHEKSFFVKENNRWFYKSGLHK